MCLRGIVTELLCLYAGVAAFGNVQSTWRRRPSYIPPQHRNLHDRPVLMGLLNGCLWLHSSRVQQPVLARHRLYRVNSCTSEGISPIGQRPQVDCHYRTDTPTTQKWINLRFNQGHEPTRMVWYLNELVGNSRWKRGRYEPMVPTSL